MRSRARNSAARGGIPDREGEHPAQLLEALRALLLVEVDDDFRVGVGAEPVPLRDERRAKLLEIVNLAVEDDPDRAVLVRERLVPLGQVNDAQPAVAESDAARSALDFEIAEMEPRVIGPAMRKRIAHARDVRLSEAGRAVQPDDSADAAHSASALRYALGDHDFGIRIVHVLRAVPQGKFLADRPRLETLDDDVA